MLSISIDVFKKLEEQGIKIKSKFGEGAIMGLPQNTIYIKVSDDKVKSYMERFINTSTPELSDEEIEKFTEWMNDFQVTNYTGRSGQIATLVGEKEWLENSAKNNENRNFDIIDLNNDKLVGTIGLEHFN